MNLAIIQARMGSSRLPEKVLMPLCGIPVLEHVVNRVKRAALVDEVMVATTVEPKDQDIVRFCNYRGIRVYAGSENDVLDRYFQSAGIVSPDHIIRITADCPLMDPSVVDQVILTHLENKNDYTSNTLKETYPDGEDVEVFTYKALKKSWYEAELLSEREHVTPYMKKHPEIFKQGSIESPVDYSDKRWTLDNQEDLIFLDHVFQSLYEKNPCFSMEDVLKLLEINPEWENINSHIMRNEGYAKSLLMDEKV